MAVAFVVLALMLASILCVVAAALSGKSRDQALKHRVDLIAPDARRSGRHSAANRFGAWTKALDGHIRSFFGYGMARSWGLSATSAYLLLVAITAAIVTWGLVGIVFHLPHLVAGPGSAIAFYLFPRSMLNREQRRGDAQFSELLPDTVDMVVRMVRAGLPVGAAIRAVSLEAEPPLKKIFGGIADLAEIGVPLTEALTKTTAAIGNPDFSFFGVAVALQQSTGGNLAATLETLSEIVRRRRAVRLKARAATAEIRVSAIVLACIPVFIVGALLLVSPDYLKPLISDPRGNLIVGTAAFSLVLAGVTMRAMMRTAMTD